MSLLLRPGALSCLPMYQVRHQVYATLEGLSLEEEALERIPEVSDVGRYKNADHSGIRYPERALFHLPDPQYDYTDVTTCIDRLETRYPDLRAGGVAQIILRWTLLSNDPGHEVNTELDRDDLERLVNMNASLAVTFYAKAHF